MIIETLQTNLQSGMQSDLFLGGLALGSFGIIVAFLTGLLRYGMLILKKCMWVSLKIDNRSTSFEHFCLWLDDSKVLDRARHVRIAGGKRKGNKTAMVPALGRHWFFFQGNLCCLDSELNEKARVGPSHNAQLLESIKVTIFLGRLQTIQSWILKGKAIAKTKARIGPGFYVLKDDYWGFVNDVPRRNLDSVIMDDDRIYSLLDDMKWFYDSNAWYAQRGVPWRRGYLLHGPPGTGKSSLIRALASELELDIASLDIGRMGLTDEALREGMQEAPKRSLIVLEDVDSVFVDRSAGEKRTGVSFSGLLNAIDGVGAQEGKALIMTTNHKEKLDPALVRPGRADVHLELGFIGAKAAARMFDRFFPEEPQLEAVFRNAIGIRTFSPASVQCWLLENCKDPVRASSAVGLT